MSLCENVLLLLLATISGINMCICNNVRRVDRQTNALPDRPSNRPTVKASNKGALAH